MFPRNLLLPGAVATTKLRWVRLYFAPKKLECRPIRLELSIDENYLFLSFIQEPLTVDEGSAVSGTHAVSSPNDFDARRKATTQAYDK
jgi:hypothetical protein